VSRRVGWWCGWRQAEPRWSDPGASRDADYRRNQYRFYTFFILMWLAYAVAQGVAAFVRWLAGPALIARGGLQIPLMLIVLACVVLAVGVLMRNVGSPLGDVVSASSRVASGDFAVRVQEHGAPWIRTVARAFNSMTSRLEAQHRQRRDLMADVAHELRTPLTAMQGRLEGMLDGVYPADDAHLGQVLEDTRMLARLVEDLRTLAHSEGGTLTLQREPTDLGVLAGEVVALFRPAADSRQVTLTARVPTRVAPLEVDAVRIREVLANLVSNAVRFTPAGGRVEVDVDRSAVGVALRVSDTGPGIDPADLPHLFDRFYKGTSSNGSGLGLTIARNLVMAHGGTLTVANRAEGGSVFTATVPAIINHQS
jgi:signal transduction histidine kinase